jgi:hypothetical protein
MNNQLQNVGNRVLQKAGINPDQKFGSVIAIIMIISVILTLIRVIQECNKTKIKNLNARDQLNIYGSAIYELSHKRGWFSKLRIKKLLRQKLSKDDYAKYSLKLIDSILSEGETLTQDEVSLLVEAANV